MQEAINSIKEDDEKIIEILKDFEINEIIIFDKNLTLDLKGYTITNKYYMLENILNLKIIDTSKKKTGIISNSNVTIGILNNNSGNIKFINGTISNSNNTIAYGIYNRGIGTVEIIGGIVNSSSNSNRKSYGIYNANIGNIVLEAGTINSNNFYGSHGIYNESSGTIEIIDGTINSDVYGIYNKSSGILKITGGTVNGEDYGIYNENNGMVEISEGIISSNNNSSTNYGIYNKQNGKIKITGGLVNTSNTDDNTSYGIYNYQGTVEVTGGTVINIAEERNSYGIYNASSGIIIIGTKGDGIVSQEQPFIKGEYTGTLSKYVGYGIYNVNGKLYFYDGKIEGSTKAVYEIITEKEENTEFNYNEDETILTLSTEQLPIAQIGDITYTDLQEAINSSTEGSKTIKILRNVTYTKDDSVITIPKIKNIILDLNGYKIISSIPEKVIQNEGQLEIIDTSENKTGIITTTEETTIYNASEAELIISEGTVENQNTYAINNKGNITIQGGTVSTSTKNTHLGTTYGIYNTSNGTVEVTGGTVSNNSYYVYSYGIYNANNGIVKIIDGVVNSSSIASTSSRSYGICNESNGTIIIEGGEVNSYAGSKDESYGIYNISTGNIVIGIKNDFIILQNEPIIIGRNSTTLNSYGIYNPNGTLKYYDGTIKGTTRAIYGNISELENLTELNISSETIDSKEYEVLTLQQITTNVVRVNGTEYDSIEKAIKACGTTESTIEILRDSDPGATVIIEENQNITIDLKGYTINNYTELQNKGTLKIKDTSSGQTGKVVGMIGIAISNTGTMELQSGSIADSGYGIKNTGTLNITGGKIENTTYGIYNDSNGNVTITNGTIISNTYAIYNYESSATTNVNSGNITSNTYGIYNYSGTTNVSGTAITRNDYGIYNASGTTNIKEGVEVQSDTGIYVASGTVNIGETGTMNSNSPIITGENYGLSVASTGTVYMYDGQIKGKTGATQGYITYTETGYAVANKVEGEYYVDYLALAGTISTVAEVNGVSYSNLQSAINSVVGTEPQTIKLTNGIITNMTFIIAEGQNIILDMNGKTISSDLSVTINNAGNLTIIDSTGSWVGKISSTAGTAIVNSGTLTLGQDDGTVSQDLITIEGQTYGIENSGTLNFYDGTINGASAVNGTITNRATGYVIRITTVNGKERYYLST